MFKNAVVLRLPEGWQPPALPALDEALAAQRFVPCPPSAPESWGWVEPRGQAHGPLVESVGGEWLLRMQLQQRLLPASVVRERAEELAEALKQQRGIERIGARLKRELREQAQHELLPRAFTRTVSTLLWLSPAGGFALVGTGSLKKTERPCAALVEACARAGSVLALEPLQTQSSPAAAMAHWLATREPPRAFSIDRDAELEAADDSRASVRYARHALDIDEVQQHLRQGKTPKRLALTHEGRVSLVLGADGLLRRIALLDGVLDAVREEDRGFDADVALFTGELRRLLPDLVEALGGWAERPGLPAAAPVRPLPGALAEAA